MGPDRDPVVARHDRRQQRRRRQAGRGVQRLAEGLQGRPRLQGRLRRHAQRRHRRVPRGPGAPHPAGVRGRHRHHDGCDRRREARARAHEGSWRNLRSGRLPADDHRLLLDGEGRDALLPVQLVLDGDVVQQGRAPEGGPRPREAAEDVAGSVRRRQEAEGRGLRQLRLLERLGHLAQRRAARRLAQRADGHQGQRHGRLRYGAEVQRAAVRQAPREPGRAAEGQDLRLLRPHQHG